MHPPPPPIKGSRKNQIIQHYLDVGDSRYTGRPSTELFREAFKPDLPRLVWLQAPGHSDGVALCSRASLDEATEVSLLALVGNPLCHPKIYRQ